MGTWHEGLALTHADRHQEIPCLNFYFPSGPMPGYIITAWPKRHPQPHAGSRHSEMPKGPRWDTPISPLVGRQACSCHHSCTGAQALLKWQNSVFTSFPPATTSLPRPPPALGGAPPAHARTQGTRFLQGSHRAAGTSCPPVFPRPAGHRNTAPASPTTGRGGAYSPAAPPGPAP